MELLKYIKTHFDYAKPNTIILFFLFFLFFMIRFILSESNTFFVFISQIALLAIISIWIFIAPKIYTDIKDLENIFACRNYKIAYNKYQQLLEQLNFNNNNFFLLFIKLVHILAWFLSAFFLFFSLHNFNLVFFDFDTTIVGILLFIAFILNFLTYGICLAYTYFLREVSNLNNLSFNKFIPSATWQFYKLKKFADNISVLFLVMALLFSISYINLLLFTNSFKTINKMFIIMTFLFVILGIICFCIFFILPKYFLYKLHSKWKEASLKEFQKQLYVSKKDLVKTDYIIKKIEKLNQDNIKIGLINMIEVILLTTTILYNVTTILYNIISI